VNLLQKNKSSFMAGILTPAYYFVKKKTNLTPLCEVAKNVVLTI
jgi:hypothetical protein